MKYKLKDIIKFKPGYAFKTSQMNNKGLNLIKIKSMKDNKIIFDKDTVKIQETESLKDYIIRKNDILMALTGDPINKGSYETWVGRTSRYTYNYNSYLNQRICKLIPNEEIINSDYLYYWLIDYNKTFEIASLCRGSANQANISHKDVGEMSIELPELSEQIKIGNILTNIDNKIIINNQTNDNLLELGDTLYKEYYSKYENELPNGYKYLNLNDVSVNYDSKRKPMSSREREQHKGEYPYYGATSIIDYVDDYIFDDTYLLMGEDGTVKTAEGYPVLQYIWGKNWINNHAHVLQGTIISTEHLMFALRKKNIEALITGAVQPKINQVNMNKIKIIIGTDDVNKKFEEEIKVIVAKIKVNLIENETLTQIRDTLLPKLMNGEIDLGKIEI